MLQLLFILVNIIILDVSNKWKFAASKLCNSPTLKIFFKCNSYKRCGGEEIILIRSLVVVALRHKLQVGSIEELRKGRIIRSSLHKRAECCTSKGGSSISKSDSFLF